MPEIQLEIHRAEDQLRVAMLNGDVAVLDALLHPQLAFVGPDGKLASKEEDLAAHQAKIVTMSRMDQGERQIRVWEDTAVVLVEADMAGTFLGQAFQGRYRYLRVWRKEDGAWRIIAGQVTLLDQGA